MISSQTEQIQATITQQVGIYGVVFALALVVFSILWGWKKYRMKK